MADPNPALASVGSALIVSDAPSIGRNTGTGIRAKRTNAAKQLVPDRSYQLRRESARSDSECSIPILGVDQLAERWSSPPKTGLNRKS
jgi:hypothetical protein